MLEPCGAPSARIVDEVNWLCSTSVQVRVRIGTEYWGQLRLFYVDLLIGTGTPLSYHFCLTQTTVLRSATRSVGPASSGLVPTRRVLRRTRYRGLAQAAAPRVIFILRLMF